MGEIDEELADFEEGYFDKKFEDDNKLYRGWALTIFHEKDLEIFKKDDKARYRIAGEEICPKTGRKHYQSYIYFDNARTFTRMINKYKTSHVRPAKKCALANSRYCKKDNKVILEEGQIPDASTRITADKLKKMKMADIVEADINRHKVLLHAKQLLDSRFDMRTDFHKDVRVIYITGPSGSGKSLKAKELILNNSAKYGSIYNNVSFNNSFLIGYGDEKIALYDDFSPADVSAKTFIKFIDYNRQVLNIKQGQFVNNYEFIIITSIHSPYNIYMDSGEASKQWLRRIEIIDITPKEDFDKSNNEHHEEYINDSSVISIHNLYNLYCSCYDFPIKQKDLLFAKSDGLTFCKICYKPAQLNHYYY